MQLTYFSTILSIFVCLANSHIISNHQEEWACLGDEVSQYQAMIVLEYPTSARAWMSLALALEDTGRCLSAAVLSAEISRRMYTSCMCQSPDVAQQLLQTESQDTYHRIFANFVNSGFDISPRGTHALYGPAGDLCCSAVLEVEQRGSSHVLLGGHFSGSPQLETARREASQACPRYFGQVVPLRFSEAQSRFCAHRAGPSHLRIHLILVRFAIEALADGSASARSRPCPNMRGNVRWHTSLSLFLPLPLPLSLSLILALSLLRSLSLPGGRCPWSARPTAAAARAPRRRAARGAGGPSPPPASARPAPPASRGASDPLGLAPN